MYCQILLLYGFDDSLCIAGRLTFYDTTFTTHSCLNGSLCYHSSLTFLLDYLKNSIYQLPQICFYYSHCKLSPPTSTISLVSLTFSSPYTYLHTCHTHFYLSASTPLFNQYLLTFFYRPGRVEDSQTFKTGSLAISSLHL